MRENRRVKEPIVAITKALTEGKSLEKALDLLPIDKIIKKGDKVKVELRFRGRELGHKDIGKEVMIKFIDIVKEFGEPAKAPAFEGNNMVVIIDPKK